MSDEMSEAQKKYYLKIQEAICKAEQRCDEICEEKIADLKSENQKLKAALERERACVDFYADITRWIYGDDEFAIDKIVTSDLRRHGSGRLVGGKLARQTQAARDKESND